MLERFHETEEGRQILRERPRITGETLNSLSDHPHDTVGGVYYAFMNKYVICKKMPTVVRDCTAVWF